MEIGAFGRAIIVVGLMLVVLGGLLVFLGKLMGGRWLPGDIIIRRDGGTIAIPIISAIVLSLILTILLNLILWLAYRRH